MPLGCRSSLAEAGDSLIRGTPGRVGAVLTTTGRVGTARRRGSGKRDEKVYERNQRVKSRKRRADSNLVDLGRCVVRVRCEHRGGRLRSRDVQTGEEATRKGCGVLVARRPGYSWASPSSIGSW